MSEKLPEGWTKKNLSKVAEIQTGLAKGKQGLRYPVHVPYLRVANVQDGHIDLTNIKKIALEKEHLERYLLRKGDVLMTEGGDFDKLGRGDVWQGSIDPCVHQNHVFAVRPDSKKLNSSYFAALVASFYGKSYFLSCAKRSTNLASINSTQLKDFPVLLPPLPEQQKIARILSTWDAAIDNVQKLLENSRQQKKALMQQLLTGKNRLPGFSGEWKEYRLGHLLKQRIENNFLHLPLVSITMATGVVFKDMVDKKDTSTEDKSKYLRICPGDIGYNTMRMWQGVSGLSDIEGIVSPAYTICIPTVKAYGEFFAYLFKEKRMVHSFYQSSQGLVSDTWNLKYKELAKILVVVPSLPEQIAIAKALTAADAVISQYQAKLVSLQSQKKALMQQLLTGKKRVAVNNQEDK